MQLKSQWPWRRQESGFSIILKKNYDILKSKSPWSLLTKNINFNKNEMASKIPHALLERQTMCISSYTNCKLKVKLVGVGAWVRKKRAFFVPLCLFKWDFLTIVLSQYIVYWINFQNIYTSTYQKKLFHTLSCLFLKCLKAFSVFLIRNVILI